MVVEHAVPLALLDPVLLSHCPSSSVSSVDSQYGALNGPITVPLSSGDESRVEGRISRLKLDTVESNENVLKRRRSTTSVRSVLDGDRDRSVLNGRASSDEN